MDRRNALFLLSVVIMISVVSSTTLAYATDNERRRLQEYRESDR